jgi:hypothetical protein
MDQVNHFSHEHPLIFAEELEHEDKKEVICSDEEPIISGPGQATNAPDRAIFFSINPASSSPVRYMQHRLHPDHTLILQVPDQKKQYYCHACCENCAQ